MTISKADYLYCLKHINEMFIRNLKIVCDKMKTNFLMKYKVKSKTNIIIEI